LAPGGKQTAAAVWGLALTDPSLAPLLAGGGKDFRRWKTFPPETTILPG
jgi:hypothetical protein